MDKGVYKEMQKRLKGFSILHSCIRNQNCIYILFENNYDWDDEDAEVIFRSGFFYPKTERKWGYEGFSDFYSPQACVLPAPDNTFVVVDVKGQVITQTGITSNTGFSGEERIPLIRQVYVMSVREIGGAAFIAGTLRTVFRREGPNRWTCLSGNDLAVRDEEEKQGRDFGFNDIGGFSLEDIYACGDDGDLCYYNGKQWETLDSPTNEKLTALCCAPNGKVYIGGGDGLLIEGRGDEWQIIGRRDTRGFTTDGSQEQAGMGATIKDMAWYKDRLYMATDQGVYEYADGRIQRAPGINGLIPHPDEGKTGEPLLNERLQKLLVQAGGDESAVSLVSLPEAQSEGILGPAALRSLSTDGELLVLGGADKVAVYDGNAWCILYAPYGIDAGGAL
jgi:hypothetical protein